MSGKNLLAALVVSSVMAIIKSYSFIVVHEKAELNYFNHLYAENVSFIFGKINRNTAAVNCKFDITKDISKAARVFANVSQQYGNRYILLPAKVDFSPCEVGKENILGIQVLENLSNLSLCDVKKGQHIRIENYTAALKYPPYLPPGKYKIAITMMQNAEEKLYDLNWYSSVIVTKSH